MTLLPSREEEGPSLVLANALCFILVVGQKISLFLCASFFLAWPVEAQQESDRRNQPNDPIVVTGSHPDREQAVDYVRQVGVARGQMPAARWITPVCPRVLGIAEPYAKIVETEMRTIAQEAGIRAAGKGCAPNISVIFVGNAEKLMDVIDRRSPTLL